MTLSAMFRSAEPLEEGPACTEIATISGSRKSRILITIPGKRSRPHVLLSTVLGTFLLRFALRHHAKESLPSNSARGHRAGRTCVHLPSGPAQCPKAAPCAIRARSLQRLACCPRVPCPCRAAADRCRARSFDSITPEISPTSPSSVLEHDTTHTPPA